MGAADQLYGGSLQDFTDSMAEEIEKAYNQILVSRGKAPLGSEGAEDRRTLFIAIARGVIQHLKSKQTAFDIAIPAGSNAKQVTPVIKLR
jgi:hypothetical protein